MKKYWLIIFLGLAVFISGFFNFLTIARGESYGDHNTKILSPMGPGEEESEELIKDEWGRDFVSILNELGKLGIGEYNRKFAANLVMNALFEKPFSKEVVDRSRIVSEIIEDLLARKADLLPEETRIELLMASLAERISGAEFLSFDEYVSKYTYNVDLVIAEFDIGEKFKDAVYVNFPDFITDETVRSFFYGMSGILFNLELYPRNIILDLRGCAKGDAKLGAELAEYFYKIIYKEINATRDSVYFESTAQLLFNGVKRPFASCPDYKWQNVFFCSTSPLFRKYIDLKAKDIFFDRDIIRVKNGLVDSFKLWADEFNTSLDSIRLFFLVDNYTSGSAEMFAAISKVYSPDKVVLIGEPTEGNILIKNVTRIEYSIPAIKDDEGIKRIEFCQEHPRSGDREDPRKPVEVGIFIWPDSYWHNPVFDKSSGLERIDLGGITPDYLVFREDGELFMEETINDLLQDK